MERAREKLIRRREQYRVRRSRETEEQQQSRLARQREYDRRRYAAMTMRTIVFQLLHMQWLAISLSTYCTARQEIFGGQKFCGFLKIALVSKFWVFVEF